MNHDLLTTLDRFPGLRVLVVGEAMLDTYLEGTTGRLCREAPVPVVNLSRRRDLPGGAANTAMNLHALGADVTLLSVVGADMEGEILRETLESAGLSTGNVLATPLRRTLAKHRVVADCQIVVRFDQGSTHPLDVETEAAILRRLDQLVPAQDAILVSDYSYGLLSPAVVARLGQLRSAGEQVLVADSRRLESYRSLRCTAVKPNWEETCALLGCPEGSEDRASLVQASARRLLDVTGASAVAVTLDRDGALLLQRKQPAYPVRAPHHRHASVAGAGDTFSAALTLSLAAGAVPERAVDVASAAAAIAVSKEGTACCSLSELRQALAGGDKYVTDLALLASWREASRREGRTVVFTNGCFDILHSGHIAYLNQAREQGDLLVVGLNTDDSIRRLKGAGRPINTLEDRARVLEALTCVDYVVPFAEDTPAEIIRALRPDVFAKGGDYTETTLPEAPLVRELGGRIAIMPYVEDYSTTRVIDRMRSGENGEASDAHQQPVGAGHQPALRTAR
jgi:D-beta-D-heptose 7-phosphate kinase/D-beta-D-heptose 1-phosphate adenosyltransferase